MYARDYIPYIVDVLTTGHQRIEIIESMINGESTEEGEYFRPARPLERHDAIVALDLAMKLGLVEAYIPHTTRDGRHGCAPIGCVSIASLDLDESYFDLTSKGKDFHREYVMKL